MHSDVPDALNHCGKRSASPRARSRSSNVKAFVGAASGVGALRGGARSISKNSSRVCWDAARSAIRVHSLERPLGTASIRWAISRGPAPHARGRDATDLAERGNSSAADRRASAPAERMQYAAAGRADAFGRVVGAAMRPPGGQARARPKDNGLIIMSRRERSRSSRARRRREHAPRRAPFGRSPW